MQPVAQIAALTQWAKDLAHSGQWDDEAIFVNRRLLDLDPSNELAATRLARCYLERGDLGHAEAAYKLALQANPRNVIATNGLAAMSTKTTTQGSAAQN